MKKKGSKNLKLDFLKVEPVSRDFFKLYSFVTFLICISIAFSILWTFDLEPSWPNLSVILLFFWMVALRLGKNKSDYRFSAYIGAITIAQFILSWAISAQFMDNSWDGNQYQSEAPLQIFLGWNPFREVIFPVKWDTTWAVWLDSLPKFGWEISAFILHLGGTQESAKVLAILGLIILGNTAALVSSCFHLSRVKRYTFIFVAISFPIAVSQVTTSYQDGFSSSWTISLILTLYANQKIKESGLNVWPLLCTLAVGALLTKYTQIVPITIVIIGYLFFSGIVKKKTLKVISILIPTMLLGFNPFMTNLISFGNPIYPMHQENYMKTINLGKHNIIENSPNTNVQENIYFSQTARNLYEDPGPIQFIKSIFSKTSHVNNKIDAEFKFPGIFTKSEFEYFSNPDPRVGGFGPMFGLVVLVLILGLLLHKRRPSGFTVYMFLGVLGSALLTPHPWWARYVGFVYSLILILLLMQIRSSSSKVRVCGFLAAFLLIFQSSVLIYGHVKKEVSYQRPIYAVDASNQETKPIELRDQAFSGFRMDWSEKGGFVYENIEVDFFQNQIKPFLSAAKLKLMQSCYSIQGGVASWGHPLKKHVDDEFFNNSGLLKINQTCDYNSLSSVQSRWSKIPFSKRGIFG